MTFPFRESSVDLLELGSHSLFWACIWVQENIDKTQVCICISLTAVVCFYLGGRGSSMTDDVDFNHVPHLNKVIKDKKQIYCNEKKTMTQE